MKDPSSENVWNDLAALIQAQPPEDRLRYERAIGIMLHDIRQSISLIYSAESILRRSKLSPDDMEMLDTIRNASRHAISLLTDFAHPFDSGSANPARKPPTQ